MLWISSSSTSGSLVLDNVSVKEVTGDQPRLNYDISNGVVQSCPSLLLEPASTNLVTDSSDFSASSWGKNNLTITSNNSISPDGTLNADLIVSNNAGSSLSDSIGVVDPSTFSVFVKYIDEQFIQLYSGASGNFYANFDIKNNILGTKGSATSESKIENYGNGWYRLSAVFTGVTAGSSVRIGYGRAIDGTWGDLNLSTGGSVLLWGGQLEALSYPTSIIPTTGAIQTRAAETCFGAGTSSTFNDSEGVLYAEISGFVDIDDYRMISLNAGGSANTLFLGIRNDTGNVYFYLVSGGVVQSNYISTVNSTNTNVKLAVKYKTNDVSFWVNGVELYTDASATMITGLNQLEFGYGNGEPGSYPFYGKCKDLRVYNEALTDAQLQTLTTL